VDEETGQSVIPAQAGIQAVYPLTTAYTSWIPGLALLARNDGRVVFVIPAKLVPDPDPGAGIQGAWYGFDILSLSNRCAAEAKDLAAPGTTREIRRPVPSE
jgi:hypothetical protein